VCALQRYTEKKYTFSTWRQADDMTTATRVGDANHQLYAKPGKAALANSALSAAGANIELIETSKEDLFWNDDKAKAVKLRKIEPKNKANGTQGDKMLLFADCGRSAGEIVGSLDRQAVFKHGGGTAVAAESHPAQMKAGVMKTWLPSERMRKLMVDADQAAADAIDDALAEGAKREAELAQIAKRYSAATSDTMRKAIGAEYSRKLDQVAEAYLAYYNSRSAPERKRIDRELGINWYARPSVGQGYTISTGGGVVAGSKEDTWNFHWAGVVMQSDDTRDNVVLENYSVSDWDKENTDWAFETYGTKIAYQTFHQRHKETDTHGNTPTTMTIEKRPP
jgi:hypothetical protein